MNEAIKELFTGQKACLYRIFSEEDVRQCNALTQDFNPVYQLQSDVWRNYYAKPIVPGLLTEGLITQVISQHLPGGPCILLQKELVFYHPVHVGDEISAELEIIHIETTRNWITMKVTCSNQKGNEVIKGQVVILVLSSHMDR